MTTTNDSRSRWAALSLAVLGATMLSSACGTPISPTSPEVELLAAAEEAGKFTKSGASASIGFCRWCIPAIDPLRVPPNKLVTFTVYVVNGGDAPAGRFGLAVSLVGVDGRRIPVSDGEVDALRAGERLALRLRFLVPSDTAEGRYAIEVVADPTNRIHELDETDNTWVSGDTLAVVR